MVTYAERPWMKKYDEFVPQSLEPYPDHPLHEFLRKAARLSPEGPALVASAHLPLLGRVGNVVTFAQVDAASDALAAAMVEMGLKKGDRVVIVMPNCVQFVIAFYAILKAGGVVAATNPTYPP
ncbi:MAG: AMP-binding protein, partial [Anaerolineae bacterium]|nr:AMP-binding protein [Anaerolineae bacterium]